MDRQERASSRSELLKTVETQVDQLHRYETRLRDVVQAYKGVVKEKEALEDTVKVLSTKQSRKDEGSNSDSTTSQTAKDDSFADPLSIIYSGDSSQTDELSELRDKVVTLSSSIATLSQEKTRLESSYVAEKKKLRQDNDDLQKRLDDEVEKNYKQARSWTEQLQELKSKVLIQQHEREKEQTDHAVMLRELQKLLAEERIAKEHLEHQIDELKEKLRAKENQPDVSEQYEKRIRDLSNELQVVRNRMKAAEDKANEPSPLLLELQQEMAEMRAQYRIQVVQEERRANDAEDKLHVAGERGEERVSSLEEKLSELSDVVGNYERLRNQDQQAIMKLKERVTQLDLENSALVQAVHRPEKDADLSFDVGEENLDAQALATKLVKLKGLLKLANERSEKPVNIEEILYHGESDCPLCRRYQEELQQLKEEFERYKLRAQSVLKNKSRDPSSTKMEESLRQQVAELKDKVKTLRLQYDDNEDRHKRKLDELTKAMVSLQDHHKLEVNHVLLDHRKELSELEIQLKKQRDRTISLLVEKDQEIQHLKASIPHPQKLNSDYFSSSVRTISEESAIAENPTLVRSNSEEEEAMSRLLHKPMVLQGETNLLHFAEEQARRDVEIAALRKSKRQLENALRELQQSASMKEERYQEQIDSLQEDVRKHERYKSREGANLEYLKNVIYRFLISSDCQAKQQMLNAISTILEFSPREKTKVELHLKSWWGK